MGNGNAATLMGVVLVEALNMQVGVIGKRLNCLLRRTDGSVLSKSPKYGLRDVLRKGRIVVYTKL